MINAACGQHEPPDFATDLALNVQVCIALYQTANRTARLYGRLLTPHGLTFTQYQVLIALLERGQCSVGKLCATLDLDTSTITSVLKRLQASGFVMRFRDRLDERRVFAVLTDKGRAFEPEARSIRRQYVERIGFTAPELGDLRHALLRISQAIEPSAA